MNYNLEYDKYFAHLKQILTRNLFSGPLAVLEDVGVVPGDIEEVKTRNLGVPEQSEQVGVQHAGISVLEETQ